MIAVILKYLFEFICCAIAVVFYSLLMASPTTSILPSAVVASVGYIIYDIIFTYTGYELSAYFFGTLVIAVASEILARKMKMPAIIFVFPSIVPLVPGIGLYRTMLMLVQNNFNEAIRIGVNTFFIAGAMSAAIALTNLTARYIVLKKIKQ